MDERTFYGPVRLFSNPQVYSAVMSAYRASQSAGDFPMDRDDPTGEERVVWATLPEEKHDWSGRVISTETVVGFATFYEVSNDRMWLDLLFVAPEHRRRGLARELLLLVRDASIRWGSLRLLFGTGLANLPMNRFADRIGFTEESVTYAMPLRKAP